MKLSRWLPVILLALAAVAAVTGLVLTRSQAPTATLEGGLGPVPPGGNGAKTKVRREWMVDDRAYQTARGLGLLAETDEEKQLLRQAQRLATHELDLAYNEALRQAAESPVPTSPQIQELLAQKGKMEAASKADQDRIAVMDLRLKAAGGHDRNLLETQLSLAKAQLELDQDELDQVAENLERLGADPQAWLRRLQEAHAALDNTAAPVAPPISPFQSASLLGKFRIWSDARAKSSQLAQAQQAALDKIPVLARRRDQRAKRVEAEQQERERTRQAATDLASGAEAGAGSSMKDAADSTLASLQHFMGDQRSLSDLGRRMEDSQELADTYASWGLLAAVQQRTALNHLIRWTSLILIIAALVLALDRLLEVIFRRITQNYGRVSRMMKVVRVATLALGIVAILFVLFGPPSQLTTLFGLAGAGLTVALKDFIMAFFGWFILVGRNGIHVGDWVEINGVSGEVVEIGLLRTQILETGDWNDSEHPTGRVASFVNSFAMAGHFFNFSTSGQWLWDELQFTLPGGRDPEPFINALRQEVERVTADNAKMAEQEWTRAARPHRVHGFSARPTFDLVPTGTGVQIRVRYLTRAHERHGIRATLNQTVLRLLQGKEMATVSS